jgi:hypothetical protein
VHDETDETIIRIAAALRPLPDVDPAQKARLLVAVAAERERARERGLRVVRWWRVAGGLAFAAAAGVVATLWLRDVRPSAPVATIAPTAPARTPGAAGVSAPVGARLAGEPMGVKTVQVVLRAPDARRVSVVGDFNGWDARADAMTRDAASGLWSHTLALLPGRHVYAFVVDDSMWMRDPRSPAAADADFGRPGSILLVGQP